MGKVAPPITNETKSHDILDVRRKGERWHHVTSWSLQMPLDEIQCAPEVGEPSELRYLRVRCEIRPMPTPSANIPVLHEL